MLYIKQKGIQPLGLKRECVGLKLGKRLTSEWKERGLKEQRDYSILTSEIHEATFGVKPSEHKDIKGLERENLRDHIS